MQRYRARDRPMLLHRVTLLLILRAALQVAATQVAGRHSLSQVGNRREATLEAPVHNASGKLRVLGSWWVWDALFRSGPSIATYNHLPKAGGTFVTSLLKNVVPKESLIVESEFEGLHPDDSKHFTIGSIRNPCDYYVSLYSYGVEQGGKLRADLEHETKQKLYKADSKETFYKWLQYVVGGKDSVIGLESVRVVSSYGRAQLASVKGPLTKLSPERKRLYNRALTRFDPASLNCWLRTEHLTADLKTCLMEFAYVNRVPIDWDKFNSMVQNAYHNPSHHAHCSNFYSKEAEEFVRRIDSQIFQKFNYTKCCA